MLRTYGVRKSRKNNTRKLAQARIAVGRASQLLRARSAGPLGPLGPGATRGFYGMWQSRGRNELKSIDVSQISVSTVNPNTGNITLLNGVATGTDYTNRIGRKIVMKSLLLRLIMQPTSGASVDATTGDFVRIMIVLDTQPNGVTATIADVLNNANVYEPLNLNNRDRFKMIVDKCISFSPYTLDSSGKLATGSPTNKCIKIYKKMNTEVIFNGTGSTIGSIQTGALLILQLSNNQRCGTTFTSRVRFQDG